MPEAQNTQTPAGSNPADQGAGSKNGEETPKTYSQEQVSKMVQERVNELNAKHAKELDEKLAAQKAEIERQAKLTEEERAEEARKADQEKFDNERREFHMEKSQFEAEKILSEKGVPTELAKYVLDEDMEQTKKNATELASAIDKVVEEKVKAKTKNGTPSDKGARTNIQKEGSKVGVTNGSITSF